MSELLKWENLEEARGLGITQRFEAKDEGFINTMEIREQESNQYQKMEVLDYIFSWSR